MKTMHAVWLGNICMVREKFPEQAMDSPFLRSESWVQPPVISSELTAPDDRPSTTPPWPGGAWGGGCGATKWVEDPDFSMAFIQDTSDLQAHATQAWHVHWTEQDSPFFPLEDRERRALKGFRIACEGARRHEGPCQAGPWRWTWELAEDARENIARKTGIQRLAV